MAHNTHDGRGGYESPDEHSRKVAIDTAKRGPRQDGPSTPMTMRRPNLASRTSSLNDVLARAPAPMSASKVGLRERITCFRWTWFTMTMATGGIANVLFAVPFRSEWLDVVGTIFFIFNLTLFLFNLTLIILRFWFEPGTFVGSFTHQVESLFTPAIVVSIGVISVNICQYGVPRAGEWLLKTMEVIFWIYVALSTLASTTIYLILWSTQVFPVHTMTPVWVFPAYPMLLAAPFAGNLINSANATGRGESIDRLAITVCAVAVQATGFLLSFMVCAAFLYRLMTQKLPRDDQRPGVFISIGPSGFTTAGIIQLGSEANKIFPRDFLDVPGSPNMLKLLAYITGLCLWAMCIWFFLVSVGSMFKYVRMPSRLSFQMTWYSFVFPTSALITATQQLARAFDSHTLQVLGCVLTGCIMVVWAVVFTAMIRAIWRRELLWPKAMCGKFG